MSRIFEVLLSDPIEFNGEVYSRAAIDLDHINYGLNPRNKELNLKQRSDFSIFEICLFLAELDGIELVANVVRQFSYYTHDLKCPVIGSHFGKQCRLVFLTNKDYPDLIFTVTLFRIKEIK